MKYKVLLVIIFSFAIGFFNKKTPNDLSNYEFKSINKISYKEDKVYILPVYPGYNTTIEVAKNETINRESIDFGRDIFAVMFPDKSSMSLRFEDFDDRAANNLAFTTNFRTFRFFIPETPPKVKNPKEMNLHFIFRK